MTVATTPWAANFARRWVWLYTHGLGAELRDGRRDEVESDLWEQAREAKPGPGLALALLARCLGGLTADVSWRMEHAQISSRAALAALAALAAAQRVATAGRWTTQRGLPRLTVVAAVLTMVLGALVLLSTAGDQRTLSESLTGGSVLLVLGLLTSGGARLLRSWPRLGAALILAGTAPIALILWATVVAPLFGVAIAASALTRARAIRAASRRGADGA